MPEPDFTAQMDQLGAHLETLAGVTGQYYRALVTGGVPQDVAATLTRDWHWLQWRKTYFPTMPPGERPDA